LDIPRYGCVNVYASLLPELRGAAPINWAIIRGCNKTGVTTMLMNEGIDTGDMLLRSEVDIKEEETAEELHDKLMEAGAKLLIETLDGLERGSITPEKQDDSKSTYAPIMTKELGHIDWNKDCKSVHNLIRGVTPWPGAYCYYEDKMIKIWKTKICRENKSKNPGEIVNVSKEGIEVACNTGSILIMELQEVGSKRKDVNSYLNGHTISEGSLLK
jgi:methionyl-tRNA formyltransferase